MTFYEAPCATAEQAYRAALAECVREQGKSCLAYGGVDCKECSMRGEGLKRRAARHEEEEKETVAHHGLVNGPYVRLRKRNEGCYWHLEIGEWAGELGEPRFFRTEKSLLVEKELVPLIAPLYQLALEDIKPPRQLGGIFLFLESNSIYFAPSCAIAELSAKRKRHSLFL